MWWPLRHLRKLLQVPTAAAPPVSTRSLLARPSDLLARAWTRVEALLDAWVDGMESYNQWIIEMLADDSPRPPSWAADVQESAAPGSAATASPPRSSASTSTHWASTTFSIDDPGVMLNSLSDSSDEGDDAEGDEGEEEEEEQKEQAVERERAEPFDEAASDAGLDEERSVEGEGSEPLELELLVSDDPAAAGATGAGASDEVRALKAACDFYMQRCDQLRDAVRSLSAELIETRAVLERRRELELLRRPPSRVDGMRTSEAARKLMRVVLGELGRPVERPASGHGDSNSCDARPTPRPRDEAAPDASKVSTAPPEMASSGDRDAGEPTKDAALPPIVVFTESLARAAPREPARTERSASTSEESDIEPPEEPDVVVPIRPEGTSYQQLTQLPVKHDGNWHRHILHVLKAERELRRQQQNSSDRHSSDSSAETASHPSTDDDGDDPDARRHRRRLVLRSSSSSASDVSSASLVA